MRNVIIWAGNTDSRDGISESGDIPDDPEWDKRDTVYYQKDIIYSAEIPVLMRDKEFIDKLKQKKGAREENKNVGFTGSA